MAEISLQRLLLTKCYIPICSIIVKKLFVFQVLKSSIIFVDQDLVCSMIKE